MHISTVKMRSSDNIRSAHLLLLDIKLLRIFAWCQAFGIDKYSMNPASTRPSNNLISNSSKFLCHLSLTSTKITRWVGTNIKLTASEIIPPPPIKIKKCIFFFINSFYRRRIKWKWSIKAQKAAADQKQN